MRVSNIYLIGIHKVDNGGTGKEEISEIIFSLSFQSERDVRSQSSSASDK